MKRNIFFKIAAVLPAFFLLTVACNESKEEKKELTTQTINNNLSAEKQSGTKEPIIQFKYQDHEFGTILEGESVAYTFRYKNIGTADLVITDAKASCGCTVPKFSKEPIAPGGSGEVEVIFNSAGREGKVNKTITVMANTQPNTHTLRITGEVIKP
ncbi:MAG: DUF1573 domain-containing protein [Bacteroidales bacterium]|nr:DUF1573 domain-containing protein [Bacteroidales bacterium]